MAYTTTDDPSAHFHIQLWTGDGTDDRTITNDANAGDFEPDLLILKNRSSVSSHSVFDSSRDAETIMLRTNSSGAEEGKGDRFNGFTTDGFTVHDDTDTNADGDSYIAWQWIANAGSRTTNSESGDNPAGGYQANTTAGFSIVDYTGTGATGTMAHGLGVIPNLILVKNRDVADSWAVYHSSNTSAPATDYLVLDTTAATADDATYWNDTAPTSSVFTVNTAHNVNADAEKYIAYCWANVQGYSKFGGYTGNGNADGPFVYTGFKPAYLIIKETSSSGNNWLLWNNKSNPVNFYGGTPIYLSPDENSADNTGSGAQIDFYANGFKLRTNSGIRNGDGDSYIYIAFAEQPFVTSGGVPCAAH